MLVRYGLPYPQFKAADPKGGRLSMNRVVHKACAWSGVALLVIMGIGFIGLAGFIPTVGPDEPAADTYARIIGNRDTIRWGLILTMIAATLLGPFYAEIAIHMRRIEGRYPVLALIQLTLGVLLILEFIYLIFFWQVATFRTERSPEIIQLLNDMAWIPFVGITSTAVLATFAFAVAILTDRRPSPVFPRSLGYFNLWVALMFTPGTFNVFFKSGPLAWNGIISWYLPVVVFAIFLVVNGYFLSKAIDSAIAEEDDPRPTNTPSTHHSTPV
jgi:hypothetical protein